jgi:fructose-bisphosphate aldolase, class II
MRASRLLYFLKYLIWYNGNMKSLKEYIYEAEQKKVAVGHFNISNLEGLWGTFNAARKLNVPVLIGVSEGERDYIGVRQSVALVKSLREEFDYPVFINADHTYSFERVKEAIDAGFDSVIFDGAKLSFDENVRITKQCVDYAKQVSAQKGTGHTTLIEGELGYIGQSSKLLDKVPDGVNITSIMTKPEELRKFVELTGIDLLAPAIGNFHGMLKSGPEPIHTEMIPEIRAAAGVPLVLHGGSGISREDFLKAIHAGMAEIHISTEIRVAMRAAFEQTLKDHPDEIAPYKYLAPVVEAVEKAVEEKLRIFNNL